MSELLQSTEDAIQMAGELLELDQFQLASRLLQLQSEWQQQGMTRMVEALKVAA